VRCSTCIGKSGNLHILQSWYVASFGNWCTPINFTIMQNACISHIRVAHARGRPIVVPQFVSLTVDYDTIVESVSFLTKSNNPSRVVDSYQNAWWEDPELLALSMQCIQDSWMSDHRHHSAQVCISWTLIQCLTWIVCSDCGIMNCWQSTIPRIS